MSLTPGTRIGAYEVAALIGVGGMGEVYQATDTHLRRQVAIKVLPASVAADADRLARFQREAEVLAALNHPNIAQIHGLEKSGGTIALVMELVEGPTLADRIGQGAIPIDEALPIATQIADALEAAHEQGFIHRDLKPANIKLRPDGIVKLLDFGLAKALDPSPAAIDASRSPTITTPAMMTGVGVLLGTAAYMSPEQARGQPVDKRTDVWAFGCVLFEMLTGTRAFGGDDVSETLAAVIKSEPDWRALPREAPPSIRRLLRRALTKNRRERIGDATIARIEINEAASGDTLDRQAASGAPQPKWRVLLMAFAVSLAAVIAVVAFRPVPAEPELRFEISGPPSDSGSNYLAISPAGQEIVFVAAAKNQSRLWLRSLDSEEARPLEGTDGAGSPFFSPDGRSVAFGSERKLKRIDLNDGSIRTLADAREIRGGSWNRDGVILIAASGAGPIFRVSATGGTLAPATRIEAPQARHVSPQFLPDGRHFIYTVGGPANVRGVYVGELDQPESRRLLQVDAGAVYTSDHLLFVRDGTLFAQPFDPVRLALGGDPFPVAEQVSADESAVTTPLAVSDSGSFVYRRVDLREGRRRLVWFDRSGKEIETLDVDRVGDGVSMSPDGSRLAMAIPDANGKRDIWIFEARRSLLTRFTSEAGDNVAPTWSPDGSRIAFVSNRGGVVDLYERSSTGSESRRLPAMPGSEVPWDWSPDGRLLLYRRQGDQTGEDLWTVPVEGESTPSPVVNTLFNETRGQFSPDGNWIAYESDESGSVEIYVQPVSGHGNREQISVDGGTQARWRHDGREVFYVAPDGRLMAVPIRFVSLRNDRAIEVEAPVPLFAARVSLRMDARGNGGIQYFVSSDGQRFLINTETEDESQRISVILNWKPQH